MHIVSPQAIRGDVNHALYAVLLRHLGDVARPFHVGRPEKLVSFTTGGHDSGAMNDGLRQLLSHNSSETIQVTNVSLNSYQLGVRIIMRLQINADAAMPLFQQHSDNDAAEKAGSSRN
jgi:hypothetical protein